jgi:uncharacterized protein (AIM24 family)
MKFELINPKMLAVDLSREEVLSAKGAMIACSGDVRFSPASTANEGMQSLAMRGVTGEAWSLMRASGSGQVLYARRGEHITLVALDGETFYAESHSVLAFDARIRTGTFFQGNSGGVQGLVRGAATGQDLFTTTFDGQGELAILSDGGTIALEVQPDKPVFVDPNAYVGHKGNLASAIHTDVSWKTLVGQGSGESFQLKFTGAGTVYVQASES